MVFWANLNVSPEQCGLMVDLATPGWGSKFGQKPSFFPPPRLESDGLFLDFPKADLRSHRLTPMFVNEPQLLVTYYRTIGSFQTDKGKQALDLGWILLFAQFSV
jgi:hypothetical protein